MSTGLLWPSDPEHRMDHLWAPWRFPYITSTKNPSDCVFCAILAADQDSENHVLVRWRHNFIVLNRFPYTTGHLLVVAHRHVASLSEATPDEVEEMAHLSRDCEIFLRQAYNPDGFNVGLNIGHSAGAGIAGHLHLHVVPRWIADANYISVLGQTRVIPENLQTTFEKLLPFFEPSSPPTGNHPKR